MNQQAGLSKTIGEGQNTSPTAVMRRLWPYIRPLMGIVALGLIAMAFVAASEAGIPMLLKPLLDHGFGTQGQRQAPSWVVPVAVIGLALVRGVAQYASGYLLVVCVEQDPAATAAQDVRPHDPHERRILPARDGEHGHQRDRLRGQPDPARCCSSVIVTLVRDSLTVVFLLGYLFYPELAPDADRRGDAAGHRLAGGQDQPASAAPEPRASDC